MSESPLSEEAAALLERWPLASKFNLPIHARVVVAGAYKGAAMELLRYLQPSAHLVGFEPQGWALQEAAARMHAHPVSRHLGWWAIEPYGLGTADDYLPMGEYHTDGASFVNIGPGSREQGSGPVREFSKAMHSVDMTKLDLLLLNMEGYEWQLIPHLIQQGWLAKINSLAVQFHLGFGNEQVEVLDTLDTLYTRTVDEYPTWVLWTK